jgi:hypothetical protein
MGIKGQNVYKVATFSKRWRLEIFDFFVFIQLIEDSIGCLIFDTAVEGILFETLFLFPLKY